jgi:hypothetical protein
MNEEGFLRVIGCGIGTGPFMGSYTARLWNFLFPMSRPMVEDETRFLEQLDPQILLRSHELVCTLEFRENDCFETVCRLRKLRRLMARTKRPENSSPHSI